MQQHSLSALPCFWFFTVLCQPFPNPLRRTFFHSWTGCCCHIKLKPFFFSSPSQVPDSLKRVLFCRGVFPSWFFTFPNFLCKLLLSPASKGNACPSIPRNLHNLTFSRMEQFLCYLKITSPFRCQQSLIVRLFIDRETSSPPFFPVQHLWDRAQEKVVLGHKCGYHL